MGLRCTLNRSNRKYTNSPNIIIATIIANSGTELDPNVRPNPNSIINKGGELAYGASRDLERNVAKGNDARARLCVSVCVCVCVFVIANNASNRNLISFFRLLWLHDQRRFPGNAKVPVVSKGQGEKEEPDETKQVVISVSKNQGGEEQDVTKKSKLLSLLIHNLVSLGDDLDFLFVCMDAFVSSSINFGCPNTRSSTSSLHTQRALHGTWGFGYQMFFFVCYCDQFWGLLGSKRQF